MDFKQVKRDVKRLLKSFGLQTQFEVGNAVKMTQNPELPVHLVGVKFYVHGLEEQKKLLPMKEKLWKLHPFQLHMYDTTAP